MELYNTLHRKKEVFTAAGNNTVRVYSCGPTVYSRQHIGNMRAAVFVDVLKRVLRYNGYEVLDVVNITDVGHLAGDNAGDANIGEDRMEKAARAEGKDPYAIARHYEALYLDDLKKLNIVLPKYTPRATEHIAEQIAFIQAMEARGYTYTTDDGVYFDVSKLPTYGRLSGQKLEDKEAGARVAERGGKRHPADFALWKFLVGEHAHHVMRWESPWGPGFPGWHIECSAMGEKYLGKSIDIHTGGIEHIPVHHENEIAQNEGSGKLTVRFWLHNEHLLFAGGKMAKSEGNVYSLDDLLGRDISPLTFRYWLLSAHYRSPHSFTWASLEAASLGFERLLRHVFELPTSGSIHAGYQTRFAERINDDLDIPQALALVSDLLHDTAVTDADKRATLTDFDRVFGFGFVEREEELRALAGPRAVPLEALPQTIRGLLAQRDQARTQKAWNRADALRAALLEAGYTITDHASGTEVYPVRKKLFHENQHNFLE